MITESSTPNHDLTRCKPRHLVSIGNVKIGGNQPVVVQCMTNTDTADVASTVQQILVLAKEGAEIVRVTVNTKEAAQAVPKIKELLLKNDCHVPLVGCFHYNGHQILQYCADALDKYRINPGNVGVGDKRASNFALMVKTAIEKNKPIRIGANWGSLDQELTAKLIDENNRSDNPLPLAVVQRNALIHSALSSAEYAESLGLPPEKIVISCKVSQVQELVVIYRELAKLSKYALHLGLTEAGMGIKGITASVAGLAILLAEGIGDTIRVSLTPKPGEGRATEVAVCKEVLQSLGLRFFAPQISSCPGCGRTTSDYYQNLAAQVQEFIDKQMPIWQKQYSGVEKLKIAVMGCIVNGPGESKHADIGISLPGSNESPAAPVFVDGKLSQTLRGDDIPEQFKIILENYIKQKFT